MCSDIKVKAPFISFEGTDYCGKSTQITLLEEYFQQKNITYCLTREPGGTKVSEQIRSVILDAKNSSMHYLTELLLYEASRAQVVNQLILPKLQEGTIVVSDRYFDSTTVYQGMARGISLDKVAALNLIASNGLTPTKTILLQLPLKELLKRRSLSKGHDRLEQEDRKFFAKIIDGYAALAKANPERFIVIDATKSKEEIQKEIRDHINRLL